jgi:hypothetical protein
MYHSKQQPNRAHQLTLLLAIGFVLSRNADGQVRSTLHVLLVGNSVGSYWNCTAWAGEIAKSIGAIPVPEVQSSVIGRTEGLQSHLLER